MKSDVSLGASLDDGNVSWLVMFPCVCFMQAPLDPKRTSHVHPECLEQIGYPDDGQVLTSFQTPLRRC